MMSLFFFSFFHMQFIFRKRINQLEQRVAELLAEEARLKEVAAVAAHQTEAVGHNALSQSKEISSLRIQLAELQMKDDGKASLGKLHHQIIALQVCVAQQR